jgi:hypothetical protein
VDNPMMIKAIIFTVLVVSAYLFAACVIWKGSRSPWIWKVYISGPDDIHGPFSEIRAHRLANYVNKAWLKKRLEGGCDTPLYVATVIRVTRGDEWKNLHQRQKNKKQLTV